MFITLSSSFSYSVFIITDSDLFIGSVSKFYNYITVSRGLWAEIRDLLKGEAIEIYIF